MTDLSWRVVRPNLMSKDVDQFAVPGTEEVCSDDLVVRLVDEDLPGCGCLAGPVVGVPGAGVVEADAALPAPDGTCYVAEQPLAALLEVARGLTLFSEAFLNSRRLLIMRLPQDLPVADLTAARAYRYGVTAEVAATSDYDVGYGSCRANHRVCGADLDGLESSLVDWNNTAGPVDLSGRVRSGCRLPGLRTRP